MGSETGHDADLHCGKPNLLAFTALGYILHGIEK
jgi:hypothetical protein